MSDEEAALTPAERARLESSGSLPEVPPDLEDRVVATLRRRGLLDGAGRRRGAAAWRSWAAAAAIFLAAGLAGYAVGRAFPPPARSADATAPRFLLLLHEDAAFRATSGEVAHRQRVEEYTRWARELGRQGALVAGEELAEPALLIDPRGGAVPLAADDRIAGYFLIRAADEGAAVAVARTCPHLRHGGRVEVRRIRAT